MPGSSSSNSENRFSSPTIPDTVSRPSPTASGHQPPKSPRKRRQDLESPPCGIGVTGGKGVPSPSALLVSPPKLTETRAQERPSPATAAPPPATQPSWQFRRRPAAHRHTTTQSSSPLHIMEPLQSSTKDLSKHSSPGVVSPLRGSFIRKSRSFPSLVDAKGSQMPADATRHRKSPASRSERINTGRICRPMTSAPPVTPRQTAPVARGPASSSGNSASHQPRNRRYDGGHGLSALSSPNSQHNHVQWSHTQSTPAVNQDLEGVEVMETLKTARTAGQISKIRELTTGHPLLDGSRQPEGSSRHSAPSGLGNLMDRFRSLTWQRPHTEHDGVSDDSIERRRLSMPWTYHNTPSQSLNQVMEESAGLDTNPSHSTGTPHSASSLARSISMAVSKMSHRCVQGPGTGGPLTSRSSGWKKHMSVTQQFGNLVWQSGAPPQPGYPLSSSLSPTPSSAGPLTDRWRISKGPTPPSTEIMGSTSHSSNALASPGRRNSLGSLSVASKESRSRSVTARLEEGALIPLKVKECHLEESKRTQLHSPIASKGGVELSAFQSECERGLSPSATPARSRLSVTSPEVSVPRWKPGSNGSAEDIPRIQVTSPSQNSMRVESGGPFPLSAREADASADARMSKISECSLRASAKTGATALQISEGTAAPSSTSLPSTEPSGHHEAASGSHYPPQHTDLASSLEGYSLLLFSPTNPIRVFLAKIVGFRWTQPFTFLLIIANWVVLAISPRTDASLPWGQETVDWILLVINVLYTIDVIVHSIVFGLVINPEQPVPILDRLFPALVARRNKARRFALSGAGHGHGRSPGLRKSRLSLVSEKSIEQSHPSSPRSSVSTKDHDLPHPDQDQGNGSEQHRSEHQKPNPQRRNPSIRRHSYQSAVSPVPSSFGNVPGTNASLPAPNLRHARSIVVRARGTMAARRPTLKESGSLRLRARAFAKKSPYPKPTRDGYNPSVERSKASVGRTVAAEVGQIRINLPPSGGPQANSLPRIADSMTEVPFSSHTAYLRHSFSRLDAVVVVSYWISLSLHITGRNPEYRVFATIAALRPIRLLAMTKGLATILLSLKESAPLLIDVIEFMWFFFILFAIVGLHAFEGSFRRHCALAINGEIVPAYPETGCGGHYDIEGIPRPAVLPPGIRGSDRAKGYLCPYPQECHDTGSNPQHGLLHFDNIFNAFVTTFVVTSGEGWTDLMYQAVQAEDGLAAIFFLLVIFLMTFVMIQIFIAVITETFAKIQEDNTSNSAFAAGRHPEQFEFKSQFFITGLFRTACSKLSQSAWFKWFFAGMILMDLVLLGFADGGLPHGPSVAAEEGFYWQYVPAPIRALRVALTLLLFGEVLIRRCGCEGWWPFFRSRQNTVDFILAVVTCVSLIPPVTINRAFDYLTVFALIRSYRIFVVLPRVRLLMKTIFMSVTGVLNLVLFIVFAIFICSTAAMQLYGGIYTLDDDNEVMTFNWVGTSYLALFTVLTGENWNKLMSLSNKYSDSVIYVFAAVVFFVVFYGFAKYILTNMFVAVFLENFSLGEEEKLERQVEEYRAKSARFHRRPVPALQQRAEEPNVTRESAVSKISSSLKAIASVGTFVRARWNQRCSQHSEARQPLTTASVGAEKPVAGHPNAGVRSVDSEKVPAGQPTALSPTKSLGSLTEDAWPVTALRDHGLNATERQDLLPPADESRERAQANATGVQVRRSTTRSRNKYFSQHNPVSTAPSRYHKQSHFQKIGEHKRRADGDEITCSDAYAGAQGTGLIGTISRYIHRDSSFFEQSLFLLSPKHPLRVFCQTVVGTRVAGRRRRKNLFDYIVLAAILISVVVTAMDTPMTRLTARMGVDDMAFYIHLTDNVILGVFMLEFLLRVAADGLLFPKRAYLKSPWNVLDMMVLVFYTSYVFAELATSSAPVARFLRISKAFRPLRVINQFRGIKQVFSSFFAGITRILDLVLISVLFLFPFALYGTYLFSRRLQRCNDPSITVAQDCTGIFIREIGGKDGVGSSVILVPRVWQNENQWFNWDYFGNAFITSFVMATAEGWVSFLSQGVSMSSSPWQQPSFDPLSPTWYHALFFIVFMLVCSIIVISLFVGVIIQNFKIQSGMELLTVNQRQWINLQARLRILKPSRMMEAPLGAFRARVYRQVSSMDAPFPRLVTLVIILNTLQLMMEFYGQPEAFEAGRTFFEIAFVVIYLVEIILRVIGFGWVKWASNKWNILDAIVGTAAAVGLVFQELPDNGALGSTGTQEVLVLVSKFFLTVMPLKLFYRLRALKTLARTMMASFHSVWNIFTVFAIVLTIYSILFTEAFGLTRFGKATNYYANFRTFWSSFLMSVRMTTGEDWHLVMADSAIEPPFCTPNLTDYLDTDCGDKTWALVLFTSYYIICTYIFLNMFIVVLLDNFAFVYSGDARCALISDQDLTDFKRAWALFDQNSRGFLKETSLVPFLNKLTGKLDCRVYPDAYRVPEILARAVEDVDVTLRDAHMCDSFTAGVTETHQPAAQLDVVKLDSILGELDVENVRTRREKFNIIYREARKASDNGYIRFNSMLRICVINSIDPRRYLRIDDLLRRQQDMHYITTLIAAERVIGSLKTYFWRKKLQRMREQGTPFAPVTLTESVRRGHSTSRPDRHLPPRQRSGVITSLRSLFFQDNCDDLNQNQDQEAMRRANLHNIFAPLPLREPLPPLPAPSHPDRRFASEPTLTVSVSHHLPKAPRAPIV